MRNNHVLLVSSDNYIVVLCSKILKERGFLLWVVSGYDNALEFLSEKFTGVVIADAAVIEINYPGFFRYVSEMLQLPIIVIGCENTTDEKVGFLKLGADNYISQPLDPEELLEVLRALFRTIKKSIPGSDVTTYTSGDLFIDIDIGQVMVKDQVIVMTRREYNLLCELISHAGKVLSYRQLLRAVWGQEFEKEKRYLHQYIYNLRNKIESDPRKPEHIMTVPRVGYVFRRADRE